MLLPGCSFVPHYSKLAYFEVYSSFISIRPAPLFIECTIPEEKEVSRSLNRRIERLRQQAQAWIGRRVDIDRYNGSDLEGVIVAVREDYLILRVRRNGQYVRVRVYFTNIEDIDLD